MGIINGLIQFPKLDVPDTKFTPVYTLDLSLKDNPKGVKLLESKGVNIRNKNGASDYEYQNYDFVTIKKRAFKKDGSPTPKPKIYDSKNNNITGTSVPYGSEVNVSYSLHPYNFNGNKGVTIALKDVQIIKIADNSEEYVNEFKETEGYIVSPNDDKAVLIEEDEPFEVAQL